MFNRECEKAFNLYQKAFNGEIITIQKYSEMPANPDFPVAETDKDLVLHAEWRISESSTILGADMKRQTSDSGKVAISIELNSQEQAKNAWTMLSDGGSIQMDLQPTFFAKLHGSLKDKFGVTWIFTIE
ncbi:VOC family protein [Oceanobacillus sp. CAU 1775]